jgi:gas vesicle protein
MADEMASPPMDEKFAAAQHLEQPQATQKPQGRSDGGLGDSLMAEEEFVVPPEGRPATTPAAREEEGGEADPLHAAEEALAGAAGWVKEKAAGVWQTVKAGTVAGGHKTAEGLDTVKDKVGEALGVARNKASSAAHTVVKKTQEATSPVRERAARGFHTKKEEGKETTQAIKAQLVGKAEDATDAIKAKVGEVVARGSETGAQAQERVHEMGQRVAEHAEAVKSKGQSMAQATKQSGQSGMHQAKKTAQEATGTTAEYVGGAAGKVSGLMEGTAGEVQHQPKGKEGGRIGPVTVGFGEPQLHEREGPSGIKVRGGTKEGGEESVKALARDLATFDMS